MSYSKDILEKIETDFPTDYEDILFVLEVSAKKNHFLNDERIIRCILFLSECNLNQFNKTLEMAIIDWRDIILQAEYIYSGNDFKRVRNFNSSFKKNDLEIK